MRMWFLTYSTYIYIYYTHTRVRFWVKYVSCHVFPWLTLSLAFHHAFHVSFYYLLCVCVCLNTKLTGACLV